MGFNERNQAGLTSEQIVRAELEQRGYDVHPWGRSVFPKSINDALNEWRDTYGHPCRLRWQPDFLVARPGDPQSFRAVEVKRHHGDFKIERSALNTYSILETRMWLPVLIVFHCPENNEDSILRVISAGECMIASRPLPGNPEYGSGSPMFQVDQNRTSPFDAVFGAKL